MATKYGKDAFEELAKMRARFKRHKTIFFAVAAIIIVGVVLYYR